MNSATLADYLRASVTPTIKTDRSFSYLVGSQINLSIQGKSISFGAWQSRSQFARKTIR